MNFFFLSKQYRQVDSCRCSPKKLVGKLCKSLKSTQNIIKKHQRMGRERIILSPGNDFFFSWQRSYLVLALLLTVPIN